MPETVVLAAFAFLLLAAASHRHRRDAGVRTPGQAQALRATGAAILVVALLRCGGPITGERCVRFLLAASLGGLAVVMLLSFRAATMLRPVRWVMAQRQDAAEGAAAAAIVLTRRRA